MDLVFVDANVLFSKTLRDWTLMLSQHCHRFAVVTSEDCIIEALGSIREDNPAADGGTIRQIGESIKMALHDIVDDWPGGEIEGMPDPKDWHVVHAATHAKVNILVTDNMKDFEPIAQALTFDLYTPDELLTLVSRNDPSAVEEVTMRQVDYWEKVRQARVDTGAPAPKRLSQALRDAKAPDFADIVDQTLRKLTGIVEDTSSTRVGEQKRDGVSAKSVGTVGTPVAELPQTPAP